MNKNYGWITLFLITFTTVVLFVLAKAGEPISISWRTASQIIALVGITWLCVSFLLTTRWGFVTDLFGGIDKSYKAHHIIGGLAFVMVLHHPLFLAIESLPNVNLASSYLFISQSLPYNLGVVAIYSFLLLLILTLLIELPYSVWKQTHNFMGIPLIFASMHILLISSDVSRCFPLRFWIVFWIFVGLVAAFFKRFLYEIIGPRYEYKISEINKQGAVFTLSLLPSKKKIGYRAGQFVFLKIKRLGNEYHPFSIVSSQKEEKLKIAIKILGDYTLNVDKLIPGDECSIIGPYGSFYKAMNSDEDMVMIAGGIGITPFVGMVSEGLEARPNRRINLFYVARDIEDAVFMDEIKIMSSENKNFCWNLILSSEGIHFDALMMKRIMGNFDKKVFLLCGPQKMMLDIANELQKMNVKKKNIIYEDFSFK